MPEDEDSQEPSESAAVPAAAEADLAPPAPHSSRFVERARIAAQVALQIVLVIIIFGQVNYLSCRRYDRWDLTQNRKYTLSETSLNFLEKLDSEVTILLVSHTGWDLHSDVKSLLSEFERGSGDRIDIEILDLSRNSQRLAALSDQHGLSFSGNTVVILARDRKKVIGAEELAVRDRSSGRILEFQGEKAVTSALLEVTEQQQKKIYLVSGKRRAEELVNIARQFESMASAQNARVELLMLEAAPSIPEDADALILAGNSEDLTDREAELVKAFWLDQEKKGGLLIFLDPAAEAQNLNTILRENGVRPEDDRVLTVTEVPGMAAQKTYDIPVRVLGRSPVTRGIEGMVTQLTGQTQSLTVDVDNDLLKMDNIRPWPLMVAAAKNYWGETEYRTDDVAFSEKHDHRPAVTAASIEVGAAGDPNMRIRSSRLVVVGNPNLIHPDGNTSKVNADFAMAALNWTINREELAGISPRQPTTFILNVDPARFSILQTFIIFVFPLVALILGGFVWFTRRS